MNKENHIQFLAEVKELRCKLYEMEELIYDKINNRNVVDNTFVESFDFTVYADKIFQKQRYRVCVPNNEDSNLCTYDIVKICKITGVNRRSLKSVWVNKLGGELMQITYGEVVYFDTEEAANDAYNWLMSRITVNKLSE